MPILEPILQYLRMQKIKSHIPHNSILLDIGCDADYKFLQYFQKTIQKGIGIDIVVKDTQKGNIQLVHADLTKKFPRLSSKVDVVTVLAVLEHLPNPEKVLREIYKVLHKNGLLLLTVPSPKSKPILEFLAQIGLVRKEMIDQHENYFTPQDLQSMLQKIGFTNIHVSLFQLGCNTFVKAEKS